MAITVKSEMAGMIEDVLVARGQSVGEEDEVIILSSMKMEIPVPAGRAGTIGEILVDKGDVVKVGAPLFTIAT